MQASQSGPGNLAAAIKAYSPGAPHTPANTIAHGHEGEEPLILGPAHLIPEMVQQGGVPPELTGNVGRYAAEESPRGAETATDPS